MIDPSVVSAHLRRLASELETSDAPSLSATKAQIANVLKAIHGEHIKAEARRIAAEMVRLAQEEIEVSMWDTEEGKDVDFAYGEAHREDKPEKLEPKLKLLKRRIDNFIEEIVRPPGEKKPEHDESEVYTSAPKL